MELRNQQRKAMVLSVLMIMLAQSAYSQYYQGWFPPELEENSGYEKVTHATCLAATRTSGDPINVDVVEGNNSYPGTTDCPKKSLENATSDAVNNDEIILHSGLYHENVSIDGIDNLLIRAATGEKVVFDGTKSISQDLGDTWSTADSDGIQEVTLSIDGWQLFLSYDEQVPARWPNAQFSDETVFNRSYWAEGTLNGTNNAYTQGWLTDAGPESGVHTGLNETINATGLDPVGAIAVMNLGSFRSNSRTITDWNSANGTFAYDGTSVGWKNKHHAYFLEGKRELIDVDGEWWYNNTNNRLHYKTPTGQDANNLDLRVKVQPFAISVDNSDGVTIQGIDFFGTTVNFNNCDSCSFTNATLEYPSTSKRGLGIAGESEDDRWMTRFYRSTNSFVDRISITNTDGGAIEFQGSAGQSNNNTVNNSYFHAIDWSAADQKGLMTTIYEGGRDMYFTNNTVHLTGASSVLSIGDAPKVFYNEVWNVGHLQTDGAVVQIMQGEAPGAEVAYNWIHDIIKYGIRFDAPIGQAGTGRNGTMHHNVIWNAAGGLMVKGDYHDIHNNTVFDTSAGKNGIIALTDSGVNNKNSTFHHNAVDSMADHRSDDIFDYPLPDGVDWMNWNGYTQKYANSLSIYSTHSCAILENSSLVCWGNNGAGRLGIGSTTSQSTPQHVDFGAGRTVRSLSIGGALSEHTCAILDNGSVSCWGQNGNGKLGLGNTTNQLSPHYVNIGTGRTALKITTGFSHTCALLDNQSVSCWGSNAYGQLGTNSTVSNSLTPVHVDLGNNRTAIELQSAHLHTCALLDNGSVSCWGYNHYGQMGFGNNSNKVDPPTIIPTDSNRQISSLAIGKHHTCLTYDNGSMFCSGRSNNGQLGQGNTATSLVFKYIPDLLNYTIQASTGSYQSCGLSINGSVQCWGFNTGGQLGDGSTTTRQSPVNTSLPNGRKAVFLSMGHSHTCAILDNGSTACWGYNGVGQLGLGNTSGQTTPVITLLGNLKATSVKDMLVDPDNKDFRPQWGSHLHALDAGAYDADDNDPWTAGVSWTYTPMDNPISGCMDSLAQNYNSAAVLSDGSCILTTLSSSPANISLEVGLTMTPHELTYTTPYLVNEQTVVATTNDVGRGSEIAVDSNGAVHICSKVVNSDGDLHYSTNASGSWQSATLDTSGDVGHACAIALDSSDNIHIVYLDKTLQDFKYTTKPLASAIAYSSWSTTTIDGRNNVGTFGTIAIDSQDRLHVAYYAETEDELRYATKASGSSTWTNTTIDTTGDAGRYASIAVDSNDKPHIAYKEDDANHLKYAHKMGSSWAFSTLDSTLKTGTGIALGIDSNDDLHIAYKSDGDIEYKTNKSGTWVTTSLENNSTGDWSISHVYIDLDQHDIPHVVYFDTINEDIFYMSNARGQWERDLVVGNDSIEGTMSSTINANGDLHVAYHIAGGNEDSAHAAVRSFTHRPQYEIEPALPTGLSIGDENGTIYGTPSVYKESIQYTVWANTTYTSAIAKFSMNVDWQLMSSVDYLEVPRNTPITPITFNWTAWSSGVTNSTTNLHGAGDSGNYNSIGIDSNDKVHIVFYRDDNTNLYYSTNVTGSWVTSTLDSGSNSNPNIGKYCSLAIDSNDGLHVSYFYDSSNVLKYAYKSNPSSNWQKAEVDNKGGKYTTIAIDSNDDPHIVYRDGGPTYGGDVAYAKCTSSCHLANSWTFGSIQSAGDVTHTSLAIDSDDHIHVVYYDSNNKDMFYLHNTSGSWSSKMFIEDLGTDTGGLDVDIAINPITDQPGISYFDKDATSLKYRYYSGTSWSTAWEENGGDYGRFNSIAYDSLGNVHISHERNGNDDLYYTTDKTGSWVTAAVTTTDSTGLHTDLAIDSNDDIHIAYRINTNTALGYATVQGHNSAPIARTNVSGATCSISPGLPNGLTLNQGTCTISGTPTTAGVNTTYNVTATSSTGIAKTGEFKIWVTMIAPSISYSGSPYTFNKDVAISTITPSHSGDSAVWSISPSLPTGLNIDSSTGVISGTPSVTSVQKSYNISAWNNGGSDIFEIHLTVNAQPPSNIVYSPHDIDLTKGVAMSTNTPTASGGAVTSWEISPSIASLGLAFSSSTGAISGTPNTLQTTAVTYTVWANNSGGSTSTTVNITIDDVAPNSIIYSPHDIDLTKGVTMSTNTPSVSGGTVTSWEISPSIAGLGLTFSSSTGAISGTPNVLQTTATMYTIWANNSGGSASTTVNITIDDVAPNSIVYSSHDLTLINGTAMSTTTPAVSGGTVSTWEISPSIASLGLTFSSSTGAISGTPNVLQTTAVTYTIWANNSGGSASTQMNITINDLAPNSIVYSSHNLTLTKGTAMSTTTPSISGGAVTTWEISPSITTLGLTFSSTTGAISGTPTALQTTAVAYTVWANNSGGSTSTQMNITVNDAPPSICYGPLASCSGAHVVAFAQNVTINALVPNYVTGSGMPTSCSTSPSLPTGLSISSTCVITGTPTAVSTWAFYSVTATNSGGSNTNSNALAIAVFASGGSLTITPTNSVGGVNNTHSNVTMSYSHVASNYGWTSGVTNSTSTVATVLKRGHDDHLLEIAYGEQDEIAIVFARNDNTASNTKHSLALAYKWNGTWTETIIDNGTDTGHHPSVAIDRNGAIHIAYIDDHNDYLRYATNATGTWVLTTLGNSTFDNDGGRGTAIVVHPITDAVHVIGTINDNTYRDLIHYTNETGSWVNTTITNTSLDAGHDPSMAMDGDGNLYVAYYCDDSCSDLMLARRINGVWESETVAGSIASSGSKYNVGNNPDIVIDSQGTIHIVSIKLNQNYVYLHSGTPGSWSETTFTNGGSYWPTVDVDSKDVVHIAYRKQSSADLMYITNASGSWSTATVIEGGDGGYGADMVIDDNDDILVAHIAHGLGKLQLTTLQGSSQGLTVQPIYDISPELPNGLHMNWQNGTIFGTPTEVHANTTHTVTVTALGHTTTATFTLFITGPPGTISYSDIIGFKDSAITPVTPSFTNTSTSGSVTTWAINATPPTGLTFETSNGTIWGTPTVVEPGAVFTIWANNSAGSISTTINISISDVLVSGITYSTENFTLSLNHTITATTPSTTGGTATSWGIHPGLPNGMSFDSTTGKISGTPEGLQTTAVTYTVWANNSAGSFSDQINITINDHAPEQVAYLGPDITLDYNQTMTPISGFEIDADLIGAGEKHTCAIKADGTVRCWGLGNNGRLGHGGSGYKSTPFATASLGTNRTAVDITAGGFHTCAILDDGTVSCWGHNHRGELGDGTTTSRTTPTQTLPLGRPAVAIEAGFDFTCALMDNGSIMCWGKNHYGQLGRGFTSSDLVSHSTPAYTMPLPAGRHAIAIDIGHYHVCAALDNGSAVCWGPGAQNRLGTGTNSDRNTPTLMKFFDSSNPVVDIALGRYSGCGLMENGSVTCWGKGFLGTGNANQQQSEAGVIWPNFGTGRTVVDVELGRWHNCALLDNSEIKCWGKDDQGQMGDGGNNAVQLTPGTVTLASGVIPKKLASGHWHNCIIAQTHKMYCWGDGEDWKLGDGSQTDNQHGHAIVSHFSGSNPAKAHGEVTSWAIHPALPTGLFLGSTNGTLYGRPTASIPAMRTYTIYANNSGGSTSFKINIDVNDEAPDISYSPDWFVLNNNTAMSPTATPTNAGGAIPSGIIDSSGDVGQYSSIAIDSNGYKHISYWDITNDDLKYATDISGSWADVTVDSTGDVGQHTSLAIDSNNGIHISYYDETNKDLKYATCASSCATASSWTKSSIDTSGDIGVMSSIAIDANDKVHISYYNDSDDDLKYATNAGGSWVNITVDSVGSVGYYNSIAIASNGSIHVSYFDFTNEDLKYATCVSSCNSPSSWSNDSVDESGIVGRHSSLAIDSNDKVHISYYRNLAGNLKYANNVNGSWENISIDNNGDVGKRTSIAIDSSNDVHISYWDVSNNDLEYATCSSSCMTLSSWSKLTVDSDDDVGYQTSIAIDASDVVHISYYDNTNNDLKYLAIGSSSNVYEYSISPALPSGLDFNMSTGEISGTPTVLSTNSTYTVTARNSGGTDTVSITIEILDQVPSSITYSPENVTLTNNTASGNLPLVPSITGSGSITSWELNNTSLPTGISFGSANGTLYGTATQLWTRTAYMVWANNSGGSVEAYFNLTVNDQIPSSITYNPENVTMTKNTASGDLPLTPSITGPGVITSWELNNTSLPTGLFFGSSNGTLYGTASQLWTRTAYMVYANNSGGSVYAYFNITVNDQLPSAVVYNPENLTLTNNTFYGDMPLVPAITGPGTITSWELNNTSLPNGVSFGSGNGTLYGTASQIWSRTSYMVWANNTGGSVEAYFNITVNDQVPSTITYSPENVTLTNNTASSNLPLVPSITGSGSITSWELNNTSLPTGLFFGSANGTLYGTASQIWSRTSYMVWANNTGGSVEAYFNITVNDQLPVLSYSPENLTLTKGNQSSDLPLNATLTGPGAITSWAISPALPSGLTFETSNGTIWGTPTAIRSLRTYTIWANNTGGSTSATVNITVNDELPNISYSPDWFVLTNNTAMSPTATPTNTGGAIPSTTIASSGNVGSYNSIALDSNGYRHVAYSGMSSGASGNNLMYATDASGTWVSISLDSTGNVGASPSIEIDSDDNIHITYFRTDSGNRGIKYATCSSSCSSVSSWTNSTIFSDIAVGYYKLVLSIDSNEDLHLIYYNGSYSSGNLKYATCSSSCATESSWTNITIDGTSQAGFSGLDLVIDSSDHLHVAYSFFSTKDLKYITCSSSCTSVSSWTNISVDTVGDVGRMPSIAVDSNDDLHISYYDDDGDGLKYAWCSSSCTTASSWANTSIANGSSYGTSSTLVGFYSDLAFDSDGHMHITHLDWSNRWLLYSTCSSSCSTNSSWSHSVLMSDYDVLGNGPSLVIDSNDELNIVFYDYDDNDLEFMLLDASSQPYEYSISPDLPTGLSINPTTGTISGIPRELSTNTTYTITVRNSGGTNTTTITIEVLDQLPGLSYSPDDLTLTKNQTSSDLPLTATLTGSGAITSWAISPALPSGLSFGTSNGTIWGTPTSLMTLKTFTIWANNSGGSVNATVNITVNDELPNISYSPDWFVLTNNTTMSPTATPTNSGGAVPSTIIDSTGNVGEYSSIVIDSYGFKHISYFDATNTKLKYATDKSGSWVHTTVNNNSQMGRYTSIAIDSEGYVHISYDYHSMFFKHLMYATDKNGSWVNTIADGSAEVGSHSSIAVDSNDVVHISYYDYGGSKKDLKYATCSSSCSSTSSWSKVTIDANGDVGKYNSIAIDSNDALHISYRDSTNQDLKYATCSSSCTSASSWTNSTIDSVGNVGSRTSLAIDSNDAVHISYHDITNGDLKYATDQSGSWANTTVDSVGTVGQYTSIAIDSSDVVHISYYDATNKDLKYATNMQSSIVSGVGGVIKFVDRDTKVGHQGTSIAVDSNGDVHISYYDGTNGDLKYATLEGVHPWNVYGYSISPSLPAGLSLNAFTGEISGTPTELSDNKTYTITAWNTGGSNTTTITIEVIDNVPTVSYSPENLALTNNTASVNLPLTPNVSGSGAITSWELNDTSLPAGISFGASNGTFYGTPTELWTRTAYMVYANNTGGSAVAYLNITVNDELPTDITYNPENVTLTNNTVSSDLPLVPSITGPGVITSWELNDTSLPTGISFGSTNGTLYGTPTELWTRTAYMIYANNSGGSVFGYFNLTVNDELPTDITYNPENVTLTNNTVSSDLPLVPSITGSGVITSWELNNTSLPAGISFGASNGTFYGTPTELWARTAYMVWANNTGGSAVAYLNITVKDQIPTVSYSASVLALTNNTASSDLPHTPNISGAGAITSWNLNNSDLPSGLSFGSNNGTIYGIPTQLWPVTSYRIWANNTGGSTSSVVSITVTDQVPTVIYNPQNITLINNTISSDLPLVPSITGPGVFTSWELNDTSLPTGISFGASNGTFYGTPTELWTRTAYMVWANNSGGSTVAYLNLTVVDQLPSVTYTPNALTLTNNTVSSDLPLVPSITGFGVITSWELNNTSLPTGISFGASNGTFYGTPTQLWPTQAYMIWANNSGGTIVAYLNLTVVDQLPTDVYYNPNDVNMTNNTASSDLPLVPTITGPGVITSWELNNTSLPAGISFGASNGTFYGTPTELWTRTAYMVWANNSGGTAVAYLNITVIDQVPTDVYYNPENLLMTNNTVSSDLPLTPSITGPGAITSWELNNTSLPAGISFGANNGTFYGTPTELWLTQPYMVWANNSGGSSVAYLNITVIDQLPSVSYSPNALTLTNNSASIDLPLAPSITGPGEITSWELNNTTLPTGITFGVNNGTFYGIPTQLWPEQTYRIWANNSGGSSSATVTITVVDQLPTLSYIPENLTLLNNTQSSSLPLGPTLTGSGIILEWGITDGLPNGLNFGNDNGTIWGIPTERMNKTIFTIWANNTGGSVTANINITVLHQQPVFNYSVLELVLVNNTVMTNVTSTVTGGEIVSWEASPDLPVGIDLDDNGNISGLPTVVQNRSMYMIWANNTGGTHIVYLNITIFDPIASLDYIPENITLTRNVTMSDLSPTTTGIIDSWAIYPELPDGLSFTNGTISGTPEYNMTRSTYTVYANNTGGSISHTINITVLEPLMDFEYIPDNVTLVNNTASPDMPMVPILYSEGVAETWEIWPELPEGLNFSNTTGTISGIATELQIIPVNYTIWANNSGGVGYAIVTITVVDQLPNLTYPGDLELVNNTNSTDLPMLPILDGAGVIVTWEISPELPEGLNFSSENGSITGIATELWTKAQYTVWANNSGGSSMAMFNITVVDQVPDDIGYNHVWLVLTKNENNSGLLPLTPNLAGAGKITSWEINGTLPDGLNFSTDNGTIWGVPTGLYFEWQYFTIYANNSGGTVISEIAIMVNDQIPTISYNLSQVILKNDTEMVSIEAVHGGGPFTTVDIDLDLPTGIYFGYGNATIWGHPTALSGMIQYTVWANNSGGSASTTISIMVEDNVPAFDYPSTDLVFYVDNEMIELPLTVNSTGGQIQNFSIDPKLPEGLYFGELNGTIWGTATQDMSSTRFTITAYNPLGQFSVDVDLAVHDYLYNMKLDPVWVVNDTFMPIITPSYIIPGATYTVSPPLPDGMSVNPNTGVVSGRPNGTKHLTSYTLTASVDGYSMTVPMRMGVLWDTDLDGMPDEIPPGGNVLGLTEDTDDDNDNIDDMTEIDCGSDPLDAEDKPDLNSNGNCAPEPEGIGFMLCLPIILILLLLLVLIIAATRKKDEVEVVTPAKTKPSEKKKGREKWMDDYRIDEDDIEWGEDKDGKWWKREPKDSDWSQWDKEPAKSKSNSRKATNK